ncbi:MAG: nuclease-related domain-containing protein [Spirulinaceae cyanobacterium]
MKQKDPLDDHLAQLEEIKRLPYLSREKLTQVELEIKRLRSGNKGEQDSAYFINFHYKDSQNWLVIHDLRIEYGDRVAQIDHLMINRCLEFYILETKHYRQGLKITEDGQFLTWFKKHYVSIESPIEQARRHVKVLKQLILNEVTLPKRFGAAIKPKFGLYVLISPKSRLIRPDAKKINTRTVVKADQFYLQLQQDLENRGIRDTFGALAQIVDHERIGRIGRKILSYHKPLKPNYYKRFSIEPIPVQTPEQAETQEPQKPIHNKIDTDTAPSKIPDQTEAQSPQKPASRSRKKDKTETKSPQRLTNKSRRSKYYCYQCKIPITKNVAKYCFDQRSIFGGKAYCMHCQKKVK